MADYRQATTYRVYHYYTGVHAGKTDIHVSVSGGGGYSYRNLTPDRAHHLVDLLRNEKPIWIELDSGLFQVAHEPVGEEE